MQDLHNKEFSVKESLAQRANTIIAGITTLGGLLGFIAINFKSGDHPAINVFFWVLSATSFIVLILAVYYLIRSYQVPPLSDISSPKEWLSYWNDLQKQVQDGKLASAETAFTSYLINQYADMGDTNIRANFDRGTRLVQSNNSALASFVLIILTALFFYFNNYVIAAPVTNPPKEAIEMLTYENALICIPAASKAKLTGGGEPKPKEGPRPMPRPVPSPGPNP